MTELTHVVPVVQVSDLAPAIDFWTTTLGFELAFDVGGYAGVVRDNVEVHLNAFEKNGVGSGVVRLHSPDVDAFHASVSPDAIDPEEPLHTTPHGTRHFGLRDPDGNQVLIVSKA